MLRALMLALCLAATPALAGAYQKNVTLEGDTVTIDEASRDHIAGDGLLLVMNQAASEVVLDEAGKVVGFRLSEIDRGSIFDLVGLKDGDIVTHIDDAPLTSPQGAVDLLRYVRGEPSFSYTVQRDGKRLRFKVKVG